MGPLKTIGTPTYNQKNSWKTHKKKMKKTYHSSRHIKSFTGGIDNLVNCLHGKIEGHKFAHWFKSSLMSFGIKKLLFVNKMSQENLP